MHIFSVLVVLATAYCTVDANFINPPSDSAQISDPVYKLGELVNIAWETDVQPVDLVLWEATNRVNYSALTTRTTAKEFQFEVSKHDLPGTAFFVSLYASDNISVPLFTSHDFQIRDAASSSAATSSSAAATSQVATSTTASASATSSSTQNTAAGATSTGLTGGAIGGIVVGAVAAVALIALALIFLMRRRKRSDSGTPGTQMASPGFQNTPKMAEQMPLNYYSHQNEPQPTFELDPTSSRKAPDAPVSELYAGPAPAVSHTNTPDH